MTKTSLSSRGLNRFIPSSTGILLVLLAFVAFPTSSVRATPCEAVYFEDEGGLRENIYVSMFTDTPGAIIFFKSSPWAPPGNPTHSGSTAGPGTQTYNPMYPFVVTPNLNMYFKAIAWKDGVCTDSPVSEHWVERQ
jgi:hypothetical protein